MKNVKAEKSAIPKQKPVRDKILASAVKLLENHGIRKLAQPQIAKDAQVPQGHITYYFPTRADLLLAVADRSLHAIAKVVMKQMSKYTGPMTLTGVMPLLSKLLQDHVRTRTLVGLLVESDENPALQKKLNENLDFALSLVAASLGRESDDPEVILTNSTLMGLAIHDYLKSGAKGGSGIKPALDLLVKKIEGASK